MRWRPKSLGAKLITAVLVVELVALAVLVPAGVRLIETTGREMMRERLDEVVPLLTMVVARPLFERDVAALNRILADVVSSEDILGVAVYDREGHLFAQATAPQGGGTAGGPGKRRLPRPATESAREVEAPVELAGQRLGTVRLRVSLMPVLHARRRAIDQSLTVALALLLFTVLALGATAYVLTRRLRQLEGTATAVAAGARATRAEVAGNDEVAATARAFNRMLDAVQAADARAQEETERFRNLVEGALEGILIAGDDRRALYANDQAARIFGYGSPEGLLGLDSLFTLAHPDEHARLDAYNRRRMAGQDAPTLYEFRGVRRDGETVWLLNQVRRVEWSGKPAVQNTLVDITARKQAEGALRESELYLRSLVTNAPLILFALRPDGTVALARGRGLDSLGLPQDAYVGESILTVVGERPEIQADIRRALAGEEPETQWEWGGVVFHNRMAPVLDDAGRVAQVIGISIDVTELVRSREAFERSEARYRDLIEGSIQGILVLDRRWRIAFANQAAADIYGYASPEELMALPSAAAVTPEEEQARLRGYNDARLAGEPRPTRYESKGLRKDGTAIWVLVLAKAVQWEGEPAVQAALVDITEQKATEEALRQAQKMEVVGQLTGGVAHDFNNLLTIVLGNLELLKQEVGGRPRALELTEAVIGAAERGAMLTQRLLAFSRRQALQPERVAVNQLVAGMTELLRSTLGEQVEIETVLAGGLWPALVDRHQLESALLNLAVNARDAMPQGGKLTIETANARLDEEYALQNEEVQPGQYVMLAVSDTGTGMPPEVADRAFDPFYTTKEVGRGSGLGLSMVYGFAKQSDGHVKIYSEEGQGTTVRLYLPRAPADSSRRPAAGRRAAPRSGGEPEKILVVEDDAAVRELAVAVLENLGYVPVEATDGPNALAALEAHPDVVLLFTDVVLAGDMSGVELVRTAQARRPGLKVLYTSGYTENAVIHQGRLDAGVELIEKPYRVDVLARRLRQVLDEE